MTCDPSYQDSTDIYCPFNPTGICFSGCGPTNRDRDCVNGE